MLKTKQTFDLSKVIEFLHQAFVFTEDVKHVLRSNCNEAMFSIKPWYMEVNNQPDFSQHDCTCPKAETEVEEIAAGISRTLLQTQELREKLSFNVMKGRHSKRLSVSKIYNPQTVDNREQKQKKTLNTSNKKLSSEDTNAVKQKFQKMNLSKGSSSKIVREGTKSNKEIKKYDKQLITRPGKLTATKNFLAINKSNVKNQSEINKHKDNNCIVGENSKSSSSMLKLKCTNSDDRSSARSTNELKCLIQKISSKSSNSSSDMHSIKCPSHEDVISQSKNQQHFVTVDVVDSINASNIPGEIIKPLKVYHTYLNTEFEQKSLNNGKRQKTVNKFLMEFDKVDKITQQILVQKTRDITLLHKYMSFFQIIFLEDKKEAIKSNNIETIYNELQSLWKMFETKEFDTVQILKSNIQKTPLCPTFNLTEWMSNGIWDLSYIKNFKGMSMTCCLRYTSKNNLLSFFELLQQLQHTHYSKNLIDMILKEVLPNMKMSFNSTQLEYVKLYKMIYILYQGLNPKIPVLVSTNK